MKRLLALFVSWGAPGLFAVAFLDGAGLTIPGGVDALIIYLSSKMPEQMWLLAALAVTGSILGNLILFFIARKGGEIYVHRHTLSRGGKKFRQWFQHYGMLTVFIAALVPLPVMPMKIFVVCSGALGSPIRAFVLTFIAARTLRYDGLSHLGASTGAHPPDSLN